MKFIEISEEPDRYTAIATDKIESIEAYGNDVIIRTVKYSYSISCADDKSALARKAELLTLLAMV